MPLPGSRGRISRSMEGLARLASLAGPRRWNYARKSGVKSWPNWNQRADCSFCGSAGAAIHPLQLRHGTLRRPARRTEAQPRSTNVVILAHYTCQRRGKVMAWKHSIAIAAVLLLFGLALS